MLLEGDPDTETRESDLKEDQHLLRSYTIEDGELRDGEDSSREFESRNPESDEEHNREFLVPSYGIASGTQELVEQLQDCQKLIKRFNQHSTTDGVSSHVKEHSPGGAGPLDLQETSNYDHISSVHAIY